MKTLLIIILSLMSLFVNEDVYNPVVPIVKSTVEVKPSEPISTNVPINIRKKDKCSEFLPEIRSSAIKYLGLDFPWHYNVGCAITESSCISNLISFDKGVGIFQLTSSTGIVKDVEKYAGIIVDPYNIESNIRAHAIYMKMIIEKYFTGGNSTVGNSKYPFNPKKHVEACGLLLSDVYKRYNAGVWFFAEAAIGGKISCSNNEMAKKCVRGGTCVGKQYLNFCQVNYSYPIKVYNYAQPYKNLSDGNWKYWYTESDRVLTVSFPSRSCP
ncbi:MAG: hypothetical protein WC346_04885 [Methanogenium sp.]|jgi:hypothetical protein